MLDKGMQSHPADCGEGSIQILEDVFDDADLLEPVKAHARVDQALADRNVAEVG